MNKLLLFLSFIGLVSCQPKDQPSDVAARASGKFIVQSYVVNGDTLYTSKGINKIGVSDFYIQVDRKEPDSVRVGSIYRKNGEPGSVVLIKDVGIKETNGTFQLSTQTTAPAIYESSITENVFYERSVRTGSIILPPSYSLKTPDNPASEGVVISAMK